MGCIWKKDLVTSESQPLGLVCLTLTEPEPAAPHFTLIELDVVEPMIVPPDVLHEYVSPATAVTLKTVVLYSHTLSGPAITGAGVGNIEKVFVTSESQAEGLVCLTLTEPAPVAPQITLMLLVA